MVFHDKIHLDWYILSPLWGEKLPQIFDCWGLLYASLSLIMAKCGMREYTYIVSNFSSAVSCTSIDSGVKKCKFSILLTSNILWYTSYSRVEVKFEWLWVDNYKPSPIKRYWKLVSEFKQLNGNPHSSFSSKTTNKNKPTKNKPTPVGEEKCLVQALEVCHIYASPQLFVINLVLQLRALKLWAKTDS